MKILITGGAGYLGAALVHLLEADDEVEQIIIYDNMSRGNYNLFLHNRLKNKKVIFIQSDILDSRQLHQSLKNIDVVYHLASKVSTPFANIDAHSYEQVNHWGTAELISAVEQSNVSQFIFLSSASVYGTSDEMIDEQTTPNPKSYYGISKLRAEDHVKRLFNKINTLIIRCSNVYGYSTALRFDAVINKFMFDANFFNRIFINGNGNQYRAFINIEYASETLKNLRHSKLNSGIYNLTGNNFEIAFIAETLKEIYPKLEFLFINQHIQMQQLKIETENILNKLQKTETPSLKSQLIKFKNQFTF
jgi:UDP-glucose 4-epimerase